MMIDDKKSIEALKRNNLYDAYEYAPTVYTNLKNKFFKTYKYNDSENNPFPKNIKRDKNGFILLKETPYIISNCTVDSGHSRGDWYLLSNGSRIYIKENDLISQELELLFKELCDDLGIPCASYDIVNIDGETYTASSSFLKPNDMLLDYYDFDMINIFSSFEDEKLNIDVENLLNKSHEVNDTFMLLRTLFIDFITNHYDRFPHNYRLIKSDSKLKGAILFDNGGCCDTIHKAVKYVPSYKDSNDFEKVLYYLLTYDYFKEWLTKNIDKIDIDKLSESVYKKKKIYTDDSRKLLSDTVDNNLYIVKNLIKKNG